MDLIQFGTAKSLDNNRKQNEKQINKKFQILATIQLSNAQTIKKNDTTCIFGKKRKFTEKKIGDLI